MICSATRNSNRIHHAFDSFAGLPEPKDLDKPEPGIKGLKQGEFAVSLEQVNENLIAYKDYIRLYKGWIPERFVEVSDRDFCFTHVDVDFYEPTMDSLKFFYKRTVPGDLIVCDDYGYLGTPGARKVMNDFFSDKSESIIKSDCGHAVIIKQ